MTSSAPKLNTQYKDITPDQLSGKSGEVYLVLNANGRPSISVQIANTDEQGIKLVQTATLLDLDAAKLEKATLMLRPSGTNGEPYHVTITRQYGTNLDQDTWAVDFGSHPRANEMNRDSVLGYSVPLGQCTIDALDIGRKTRVSAVATSEGTANSVNWLERFERAVAARTIKNIC